MAPSTTSSSPDSVGRASMSSTRASLDKTISNTSNERSSTDQRRRSSNTALFNNLHQYKRGGEDYQTRRASRADMEPPTSMFGSWFHSTFKGSGSK